MANRPPRLERLFSSYDPALFFVTFNTQRRARILATETLHQHFIAFALAAQKRNIAVARYVLMPDHVHLFVQGGGGFVLSEWVRMLKRTLSKAIVERLPHWQDGFFDHLVRHEESYGEKWEYVRQNPVRAGLVSDAEHWPYQGEIVEIRI
jgi:putative transposase